jgi:hypothetical protein
MHEKTSCLALLPACPLPSSLVVFDKAASGVSIPTFANLAAHANFGIRDLSKLMIPVPLNPQFAIGLAVNICELRVQGTSPIS